jgi:hypothetical protein
MTPISKVNELTVAEVGEMAVLNSASGDQVYEEWVWQRMLHRTDSQIAWAKRPCSGSVLTIISNVNNPP